MGFCKIHVFVRCHLVDKVEQALTQAGVPGFSYCRVKGTGEYANYYDPDHLVEHARVEVFLAEDKLERTVELILEAASTSAAGDGIVAVMPVDRLFRIRDKHEISAAELERDW